MKRKTKNSLFIILGIILLIIVIGTIIYFTIGVTQQAVSGVNTLSVSQADLQSSNQYLNGKVWMLTFSEGGLGQLYTGTITPSQVGSVTKDGSKTTKNLDIKVIYQDSQCIYPIQSAGSLKDIYDVNYKEYSCFLSPSLDSAKKDSGISNILYYGKYPGLTCFVFGYDTKSVVGNLGQTNKNTDYSIFLTVDGKTAQKDISTLSGSTSGAVGDYGYVSYAGNLDSGISCPQTTNTLYVPIYVNGKWQLGSKQHYDSYVSLVNTAPTSNQASNKILANNLKDEISQVKLSQSFGNINNPSSLTNGQIIYTSSIPLIFPVTTLYIKADTIGIYTPVPNFQITSANSDCFKTGSDNGLISVTLKNSGDEGTYKAYATCQGQFSSPNSASGSLSSGESRTINIPLTATASQKTQGTCTIYVESTGTTVSKSVNTCVDPQITCTVAYPNKFCAVSNGMDVVKQCSQDGATSNILETCSSTQSCVSGACKDSGSGGSDNGGNEGTCESHWYYLWLDGLWCQINIFLATFKIIFAIVGGIIGGLVGLGFTSKFTGSLKIKDGARWILYLLSFLIFGLLSGLTAYFYFWVCIIILVVLLILLAIIKIFI